MTAPDSGRLEAIREDVWRHKKPNGSDPCSLLMCEHRDWLLAEVDRLRAALDEQREQIAQAIEAAGDDHRWSGHWRNGLSHAARIARSSSRYSDENCDPQGEPHDWSEEMNEP